MVFASDARAAGNGAKRRAHSRVSSCMISVMYTPYRKQARLVSQIVRGQDFSHLFASSLLPSKHT